MNFDGRSSEADPLAPEINLIPFIDILLVLVIFLMLTTTYVARDGLRINLPQAKISQSQDKVSTLKVRVGANGEVALNGVRFPQGASGALAKALLHHSDLQVLTNNFHVAEILAANSGANLILTGGTYRRSDGGLVGPAAIATIRQFRCDLAVFGCSALDERGDMLDFDMAEVEVNRAILDHARRRILLADHSKLDRRAPVRVGSLSDVDLLITDKPLPAPLAEACAGWGTEVRIA